MRGESPFAPRHDPFERGLARMLVVSAAAHLLAIGAMVLAPDSFLKRPPALVSYTVDLVSADQIGGTNVAEKKKEAPAKPKPPPPAKKSEPAVPPAVKVKPAAEKKKVEPPVVEKKVVAIAKPTAAAQPTTTPVKVAQRPTPARAIAPPTPVRVAVAVAAPTPPAPQAEAGEGTAERPDGADREALITSAIRRVRQEEAAKMQIGVGGPLSVGAGEGAGGELRSVEYVRYVNQMIARIKDNWVWAGAQRSLEAVVFFSVQESGEIANVRTSVTSGNRGYDRSAENAVRAASPLPPPPRDYSADFARVEFTFKPEDAKP